VSRAVSRHSVPSNELVGNGADRVRGCVVLPDRAAHRARRRLTDSRDVRRSPGGRPHLTASTSRGPRPRLARRSHHQGPWYPESPARSPHTLLCNPHQPSRAAPSCRKGPPHTQHDQTDAPVNAGRVGGDDFVVARRCASRRWTDGHCCCRDRRGLFGGRDRAAAPERVRGTTPLPRRAHRSDGGTADEAPLALDPLRCVLADC